MMQRVKLTPGRIAGAVCPDGKQQVILRDSEQPGLGLRVTAGGSRSFVFQGKLSGQVVRVTLGDTATLTVSAARDKAAELRLQIREGRDPRVVRDERVAADAAARDRKHRQVATVRDAWSDYLKERRPYWSDLHFRDHEAMAQAGGEVRERRNGQKTVAGPLAGFMDMRLVDVTAEEVLAWAKRETLTRPTRTRLALRLFRAFLNWASEEPAYREVVAPEAARQKKLRDVVGGGAAKSDVLQREQLAVWFSEVRKLQSPVQAAYLQTVLLTGARREEIAALRWSDIDFRWGTIRLHDKVEADRIVPLTPFLRELFLDLRRSNAAVVRPLHGETKQQPSPWVFPAGSRSGHIAEPRAAHQRALKAAGLPNVSLHGLRRSYGTLAEWCEVPAGVVAQLQGHRPSATAEKHYRQRSVDLLRVWSTKIEAWMLEQAGLEQPKEKSAVLSVAAAA